MGVEANRARGRLPHKILSWLHAQSGMRRNRKLMLVRLRIEEKRKTLIPADDAAAVRKRRPQSY